MRHLGLVGLGLVSLAFVVAGGCGNPEVVISPAEGGGTTSGSGGGDGGDGGLFHTGGNQGGSGGGDPCASQSCPPDQHCEVVDDIPTCVPNNCDDLDCGPTEECQETENGAICVDISCIEDVDCAPEEWCDNGICADDVCVPGETSCVGQGLHECQSNGGGTFLKYTCGSTAYFQSTCVDQGQGNAYCGCEDDWDCPQDTACEAERCTGTGQPPTCFLPPEPFTNVLPVQEIVWGGTQANKQAAGSPFPSSAQVVQAPIVANLDDDNGDGLINDLDFPEIIFTSFCNSDFTTNGVLRALHGGGPNKGADYFATCGSTEWHEGDPLNISCSC
ncbi:MAG: hypothetical protein JRI68_29595, partial [Deltaproteobacteria bacterium]|nr:hypothetical protein [Deltaproteobacteria bacterium]